MDEAESGLKSALAVKVFGSDLDTLEQKGKAIKQILEQVRGIRDVTLVKELGQPSLTIKINRATIARYGVNVADINALITDRHRRRCGHRRWCRKKSSLISSSASNANTGTTPRKSAISWCATPGGQQIPLKEFADIQVTNGASFIYRQDNSRYIGVYVRLGTLRIARLWDMPEGRPSLARTSASLIPRVKWFGNSTFPF